MRYSPSFADHYGHTYIYKIRNIEVATAGVISGEHRLGILLQSMMPHDIAFDIELYT